MRHILNIFFWFLTMTSWGLILGAALYWSFSTELGVAQHLREYGFDYLGLLIFSFVTWVGVCLTWPNGKVE